MSFTPTLHSLESLPMALLDTQHNHSTLESACLSLFYAEQRGDEATCMQLDILVPSVASERFDPPLEHPEPKPSPCTTQPPAGGCHLDDIKGKCNVDVGLFAGTDLRPRSTVSADGDAFIQRSQDSAFRAQALAAPHSIRWHGRRPFFAGQSSSSSLSLAL